MRVPGTAVGMARLARPADVGGKIVPISQLQGIFACCIRLPGPANAVLAAQLLSVASCHIDPCENFKTTQVRLLLRRGSRAGLGHRVTLPTVVPSRSDGSTSVVVCCSTSGALTTTLNASDDAAWVIWLFHRKSLLG